MKNNYITNTEAKIKYNDKIVLTVDEVVNAINFTNNALKELNDQTQKFDINIFEILGMRNLSGLVGEYFAKAIMLMSNGKFQSNLHQDGYPDLLLTDTIEKLKYFKSLYTLKDGKKYPISKEVFSPYKYGGIEIKSTCGSTPAASRIPKPLIGEQRISLLDKFDWKAHHRSTNHLLAILWDFIEGTPVVVACFYQNNLLEEDWGKIVQPKEDGGRTTSVSIMTHSGIKKMCNNWIAIIDDDLYINKLSSKKWIGYNIKR